jgi:flagellar protein FlaG
MADIQSIYTSPISEVERGRQIDFIKQQPAPVSIFPVNTAVYAANATPSKNKATVAELSNTQTATANKIAVFPNKKINDIFSLEEPDPPQEKPLTQEEQKSLLAGVKKINQLIEPLAIGLNIEWLESMKRYHIQIINQETGEVIREIPPKYIVQMQENLRHEGLFVDEFS